MHNASPVVPTYEQENTTNESSSNESLQSNNECVTMYSDDSTRATV